MSKSNRLDSGEKVHYVSDSNAMMKMKVRKLGGRGHCPRKAKVWDRQLIGQHAPQMIKVMKNFITMYQSKSTRRKIVALSMKNRRCIEFQFETCYLDSHADTTITGSQCIILSYCEKECDVWMCRDEETVQEQQQV